MPGRSKRRSNEAPGAITGEEPSARITSCATVSLFVQRTTSGAGPLAAANAKFEIELVTLVTLGAAGAVAFGGAAGWSAALDEAIEVVLTSDVPAPPSAGPAWPPQVEVDLYQPPITAQPVDLEQLMVIASPLRSFEQVNAFRNRLSELHGVLGLKVGRFYRGALQVTVQYADSVPLADRLHELAEFVPVAMRQSDPGTIEIKLGV